MLDMGFLSKLLIVGFFLAACSTSSSKVVSSPSPVVSTASSVCADLVEQGFNSSVPVPGAYNCIAPKFQSLLDQAFGVVDDQSFADWVGTYLPTTYVACGSMNAYDQKHSFKFYLITDGSGSTSLVKVWVSNKDGKVDNLQVAGIHDTIKLSSDPTCSTNVNWPKPAAGDFLD